jgi:hypothetical protein
MGPSVPSEVVFALPTIETIAIATRNVANVHSGAYDGSFNRGCAESCS